MMHDSRWLRACFLMLVGSGALWIGVQLRHPLIAGASSDSQRAGAEVFSTSGCAHCHGADGQGGEKGPNLHNLRKKEHADKIRDQIVNGGNGMPPFGDALKPEQISQLVDFLRAKKWITPPPTHEAVPAPAPPSDAPAQAPQSLKPQF